MRKSESQLEIIMPLNYALEADITVQITLATLSQYLYV